MIAYDLDGVFVNDGDLSMYTLQYYLDNRVEWPVPLFQPQGRWCVVTGRPESDRVVTMKWLGRMDNPPVSVYFNKTIHDPATHKANIYSKGKTLTLFVESDKAQADYIRTCTDKPVICFSDFINEKLGELNG